MPFLVCQKTTALGILKIIRQLNLLYIVVLRQFSNQYHIEQEKP